MKNIFVIKLDQTENSTVSKLWVDDKFMGFIIEDGEHENKIHGSTRIPSGHYELVKDYTTRFKYQYGYCWHVRDVPGFSEIKIHKGNYIRDTEGCLLPNTQIGFTGRDWYGVNSKYTYDLLMELLKGEDKHSLMVMR